MAHHTNHLLINLIRRSFQPFSVLLEWVRSRSDCVKKLLFVSRAGEFAAESQRNAVNWMPGEIDGSAFAEDTQLYESVIPSNGAHRIGIIGIWRREEPAIGALRFTFDKPQNANGRSRRQEIREIEAK